MAKIELPVLPSTPPAATLPKASKLLFDCAKCPGYCCSYDYIVVNKRDVKRLARRFGLTPEAAEAQFTKVIPSYGRVLRHRQDTVYKSTCQFLHPTKRNCTVYEHRPAVCRGYPDSVRCRYYEFLMWERKHQQSESFVPLHR
jgi:uncharacterized protein